MADKLVSEASGRKCPCGFKSHHPHLMIYDENGGFNSRRFRFDPLTVFISRRGPQQTGAGDGCESHHRDAKGQGRFVACRECRRLFAPANALYPHRMRSLACTRNGSPYRILACSWDCHASLKTSGFSPWWVITPRGLESAETRRCTLARPQADRKHDHLCSWKKWCRAGQ